ncbi:hypothetical protein [Paenibacillus sp. J22TS3]|uniref:hypothetical protein n=1 Tax=Paenibacillus sp. J22TS3 TaxID=2807192 RepID=UPI001B02988D|nr:hypothetical protein [Paenibacillus sp. J22TS3]GIP21956.1 hypothetical protein J22TS3_22310 [Paenibacillus sp. J22TS3]
MKITRHILWLILSLAGLLMLAACNSPGKPYLSILITNGENEGMRSHVYEYDLSTRKTALRGEFKYTAQYPLGIYDAVHNKIFYIARNGDGKSDQLFSMDLKTKETKQLTTNLFAVNELFVSGNEVILAAASRLSKDNHIKPIASYNIDTNKFRFWWDPDKDDTTVFLLKYNSSKDNFDVALYSWGDFFHKLEIANEKQKPLVPPTYTVYEYEPDGTRKEALFTTKQELGFYALSNKKDEIIYSSAININKPKTVKIHDLKTGKEQPFTVFSTISNLYYEPDDQALLVLGIYHDQRGVYRYDRTTQKVEQVLLEPEKSYINDFQMMTK